MLEGDPADHSDLAREFVKDRAALLAEWPWLTSGAAGDAWRFGLALALADEQSALAKLFPTVPGIGRDLGVICGYVMAKRKALGDAWFEDWISACDAQGVAGLPLLVESTRTCGATDKTAEILARAIRRHKIDPRWAGQLEFGAWPENISLARLLSILTALVDVGQNAAVVGIVWRRIESKPDEMSLLEPLALRLVMAKDLIRRPEVMSAHYWKEIALHLVPKHAAEIAEAIFREQADKVDTWFAEHSEARPVLYQCVEADPAGVWRKLVPYIETSEEADRFCVGFPDGLLDRFPLNEVHGWIAEKPAERAPIATELVLKNFANDDTLASQILGQYGDDKNVQSACSSMFLSGTWVGKSSEHWDSSATALKDIARRTALPKVRSWALRAASDFREMAERDRVREAEEELRFR